MKVSTPEISWHAKDPIYSADFQYIADDIYRLATCGTDRNIRMWQVVDKPDGRGDVVFLSNLSRHTRTVNVVRFSPDGQILASAGDDSSIMLWKRNDLSAGANNLFLEEEEENKETWSVFKVLRSHLEDVYDLSWSSDGKHLLSGSVDNTAILWDAKKGHKLWIFTEHKSFVQGVAFDPKEQFMATMSCDRSCRIYNFKSRTLMYNITKMTVPNTNNNVTEKPKPFRMFLDDALKSFFRRLSFSPDGNVLVVPAGCIEKGQGEKNAHATHVFTRHSFPKPVLYLPGSDKATLAVRFCPVLYKLRQVPKKTSEAATGTNGANTAESENSDSLFGLPYRMVYAVVSEDAVLLYDTQQAMPFAHIGNIHYHQLSDLTWSHDGKYLVVSSTDGYCTIITFKKEELGIPYEEQIVKVNTKQEILQMIEEKNKKGLIKKDKSKRAAKEAAQDPEKMDTGDTDAAAKAEESAVESKNCDLSGKSKNELNDSERPDKKPRRVAVTTLRTGHVNPPDSPGMSPKTGDKPKRRVQVTTLSTPTKGDEAKTLSDLTNSTPNKPGVEAGKLPATPSSSSTTPRSTKQVTPRRVQCKMISSLPDGRSPANSQDDDASLHLVLEETSDVSLLTEQKLSLEATPGKSAGNSKNVQPKSSKGTPTTTTNDVKTPRRIQPVLLASPSTKPSTSSKQAD